LVRPLAAFPHNQETRREALAAWGNLAPGAPDLHATLVELATDPSYVLQQVALESLGELLVIKGRPVLEKYLSLNVDANLTQLAREALEKLDRLEAATP